MPNENKRIQVALQPAIFAIAGPTNGVSTNKKFAVDNLSYAIGAGDIETGNGVEPGSGAKTQVDVIVEQSGKWSRKRKRLLLVTAVAAVMFMVASAVGLLATIHRSTGDYQKSLDGNIKSGKRFPFPVHSVQGEPDG